MALHHSEQGDILYQLNAQNESGLSIQEVIKVHIKIQQSWRKTRSLKSKPV